MRNVIYAIYETNSKLEKLKIVHAGIVCDIAETLLVKYFIDSNHQKDFILYNYSDNVILGAMLSAETNMYRQLLIEGKP